MRMSLSWQPVSDCVGYVTGGIEARVHYVAARVEHGVHHIAPGFSPVRRIQ